MEFDFATKIKDYGLDEYGSKMGQTKTQDKSDFKKLVSKIIFGPKNSIVPNLIVLYQHRDGICLIKRFWAQNIFGSGNFHTPKKYIRPKSHRKVRVRFRFRFTFVRLSLDIQIQFWKGFDFRYTFRFSFTMIKLSLDIQVQIQQLFGFR